MLYSTVDDIFVITIVYSQFTEKEEHLRFKRTYVRSSRKLVAGSLFVLVIWNIQRMTRSFRSCLRRQDPKLSIVPSPASTSVFVWTVNLEYTSYDPKLLIVPSPPRAFDGCTRSFLYTSWMYVDVFFTTYDTRLEAFEWMYVDVFFNTYVTRPEAFNRPFACFSKISLFVLVIWNIQRMTRIFRSCLRRQDPKLSVVPSPASTNCLCLNS